MSPIVPGTTALPTTHRRVPAAGAVTIGRNIGRLPMPKEKWTQFIAAVEAVLRSHGGVVYALAYGLGEWQGVIEETVVVTFDRADLTAVIADLSQLASTYEQEAIALLQGRMVLIWGNEGKLNENSIAEGAT